MVDSRFDSHSRVGHWSGKEGERQAVSGEESQGVGVKSIVSGVGPSSHGKTVCNGTKVQNLKEEKVLWSW